jgi:hypothetical protein
MTIAPSAPLTQNAAIVGQEWASPNESRTENNCVPPTGDEAIAANTPTIVMSKNRAEREYVGRRDMGWSL